MREIAKSFCRVCINQCAIEVVLEDGLPVEVRGDESNPVYAGHTCVKGRSQWSYLRHPTRLLHSLRRMPDGRREPIASTAALDEIADRLAAIVAEHGPRAVASYTGTMAYVTTAPTASPFFDALLDAIGTTMRFDPITIDKGGKQAAQSFLGEWQAPAVGFDSPEAIILIGINPWLTYTGFPAGSPKRWLIDTVARGCKLIVIDPRETQVAQRADVFLQVRPGNDVQVLAAMVKVILDEQLWDADFVTRNVEGLDRLSDALADLSIESVADVAGVRSEDIVASARMYASAGRGYVMAGTGPHMAGNGTILEYLVLVIETLCGRWTGPGDRLIASPTLLPPYRARAQASAPDADWAGEAMRVRGLHRTRAGVPTGALAEEILLGGDGQIRALICWGGNPAIAFPDQEQTVAALRSLDLFVQIDPWLSESARLADIVLAPTLPLEVPSTTAFLDYVSRRTGYGLGQAYAQYTPAVVARPPDSDLLEEWEIFYELLVRLGYPAIVTPFGHEPGSKKVAFTSKPTTDEIISRMAEGSRVPLETVKRFPGGATFDSDLMVVEPADPTASERLDVGSDEMLRRLAQILRKSSGQTTSTRPYRLLCRRANHTYNTSANFAMTNRGVFHNPAYMNPGDVESLRARPGDRVKVTSDHGSIVAIVEPDPHVLPGTVSMAFGYGTVPDRDAGPLEAGSSPNRLLTTKDGFDPYTGQPHMSNVPVSVEVVVT